MLLEKNYMKYILSYKFSQDHIEMFFGLVRRMNGYFSNPTATQFQSAYKILVSHNIRIHLSASANCIPQDNTTLTTAIPKDIRSQHKKNAKKHHRQCSFIVEEHLHSQNENFSVSYSLDSGIRS